MVRFGIIGTGRISDWVLKGAAQDPRVKVTAVCSRTAEAAEAFIGIETCDRICTMCLVWRTYIYCIHTWVSSHFLN